MTDAVKTFHVKLAAGRTIVLSVFEDAQGLWAKHIENCTRVRVDFSDLSQVFLEVDDFTHRLSRAEQALVKAAPSFPLVGL